MKKYLFLFMLGTMPWTCWAEMDNYGAATYLNEGAGARASGMGGAFVAVADDVTAGYWNPAGLSQMELNIYQAGLEYAFLNNDMSMSYLSYAFLLPEIGSFSVSWMNFSIGSIETRDENGNVLGLANSSENAFFLSYGRKVYEWVKGLSLGANLKVLQQSAGDYTAVGPGLDIAALWQPVLYWDHTIGINLQNLLQGLYWNNNSYDASMVNLKIGAALKFFRSENEMYFNHLITTLDLDVSGHSRVNLRAGTEWWYTNSLGLRAGYDGQEITAGASYRPENFEVDYAFHYNLTDLANHQHRLSILLRFGETPKLHALAPEPAEAAETIASMDVEPLPAVPSENVPATVVEVQRLGGRAEKIILDKGSDQGIRVGFRGTVLGPQGEIVGLFQIKKIESKLSRADITSLGQDIEENARAVIQKPVEKK
jgi:hypothetical protein